MRNSNDPQKLWQLQPSEARAIALYEIHRKAKEEERKSRRQAVGNLAFSVMLIGFSVWQAVMGRNLLQRIAFALIGTWTLVAVIFAIQRLRSAGIAVASTGVDYYRAMLGRRRDQIQGAWLGLFGPILCACAAFVVPVIPNLSQAKNAIPFFLLLVAWAVMYALKAATELRYIRRELAQLEHPIA